MHRSRSISLTGTARAAASICAAALLLFTVLVACSSSTTPDSTSDAGAEASTSSSSGGSKDGGPNAATCAKETALQQCEDCCGIDDTITGALDQAFVECACIETCKTQCAATACASPPIPPDPADTCDLCINGNAAFVACDVKAEADCKAKNPACKVALTCGDEAKCLSKDVPDGG